jgi:uncharacterized protein YkwD
MPSRRNYMGLSVALVTGLSVAGGVALVSSRAPAWSRVAGTTSTSTQPVHRTVRTERTRSPLVTTAPVVVTHPTRPPETAAPTSATTTRPTVASAVATTGPPATTRPPIPAESFQAQLFTLLNRDRVANGLRPLVEDAHATAYANQWAASMASTGVLQHSDLHPVILQLGWLYLSENIYGPLVDVTAEMIEAGWMASPPHRENILRPDATMAGVGVALDASGRIWAVQEIGHA